MSFKPPYRYLTASSLASTLSSSPAAPSSSAPSSSLPRKDIAIIDVRDDDFEGGNIVGAKNVPSNEFNDKVKGLVQELKDVPTIVFHCSLSQQRGPKSARIYTETRREALKSGQVSELARKAESGDAIAKEAKGQDGTAAATSVKGQAGEEEEETEGGQAIYVLRDGFANFGRQYKNDALLVEKYDEEAWSWR